MSNCECIKGCPFFNDKMRDMIAVADMMKQKYCRTDSSQCARYYVFKKLGREKVPADLYPNQMERAKEIAG